jgi:hypothetical protein
MSEHPHRARPHLEEIRFLLFHKYGAVAFRFLEKDMYLISNVRRVLYVVCFLLGNSPASEFYMQTFRNTLCHLHRQVVLQLPAYEDGRGRVFRNVGI